MLGVSGNKPDKCGMYSLTSQDSMAAEWDEVHPGVVLQVYPFLSSIFSRLSVLVDQMNLFVFLSLSSLSKTGLQTPISVDHKIPSLRRNVHDNAHL